MKTILKSFLLLSAFSGTARLPRDRQLFLWLAAVVLYVGGSVSAFAQGSMTPPPGPPAPTMKSLDQVEPRKPIGPATSTVTINTPGSYYLTGDIVISTGNSAVVVSSGDVTLDLNGFSIRKIAGTSSGAGISVAGPADNSARTITIRNGHISGVFDLGVSMARAHNVTIEDLAIQGMVSVGISVSAVTLSTNNLIVRRCRILGDVVDRLPSPPLTSMTSSAIDVRFAMAPLIENCVIANVAGDGIRLLTANSGDTTSSGIIRGCVISRCGGNGIDADTNTSTPRGVLVEKCTVDQCGGDGISILGSARIIDCTAVNNTGNGIECMSRQALITGCVAENNLANGIEVGSNSRVINNACNGNGNGASDGAGILVLGSDCHIEGNTVTDADRGIDVDGTGNLIIKNAASGNTTNYDIVANNKVGVIVSAPNSIAISGSTGGAGVGTTDPWANISY